MSSTAQNKKIFLQALEKNLGIVTSAAKQTGISREIHYVWMRDDEKYKAAVDAIHEVTIDFVESKLHQKIKGVKIGTEDKNGNVNVYEQPPDTTAIIFYLKTQGKRRGYIEKQEIEHSGSIIVELPDSMESQGNG